MFPHCPPLLSPSPLAPTFLGSILELSSRLLHRSKGLFEPIPAIPRTLRLVGWLGGWEGKSGGKDGLMVGHRCVPFARSWGRRNPPFETFLTIPRSHRSDRWITNNLRFSLGGWAHVPPHCPPIHRPSTHPFGSLEGSSERSFRDLSNDASLVSFAPFFVFQFRFFSGTPHTPHSLPLPH